MQKTKLTVRVPRELLENIKRYAAEHTTITIDLIEAYLRRTFNQKGIPGGQSLENALIVRRVSGTLNPNVSVQEHKRHLENKYSS
jgi:hypothetical protein